jgi:transketolase
MRKNFSSWLQRAAAKHGKLVVLTGDLGFNAFEPVIPALGNRFVNAGVAEQNMVSLAAGLAQQGLLPICYSIAPFAAFRPCEQTRVDVCLHNLNVKIVGNGGGYGYGIMGATHHALEDLAMLSAFPNMRCYIPFCDEDVEAVCDAMMSREGPSYLRMGLGSLPARLGKLSKYEPVRQILSGPACTVVGLGPVILNAVAALEAASIEADVFAVSELPLVGSIEKISESAKRTRKLLVVEEHVARGGLAEHLASLLLKAKVGELDFRHAHAQGYPGSVYGSQAFHQQKSGLDPVSLRKTLVEWVHGK